MTELLKDLAMGLVLILAIIVSLGVGSLLLWVWNTRNKNHEK